MFDGSLGGMLLYRRKSDGIPSSVKALQDKGERMPLTDVFIRGLKPVGTPKKYTGEFSLIDR